MRRADFAEKDKHRIVHQKPIDSKCAGKASHHANSAVASKKIELFGGEVFGDWRKLTIKLILLVEIVIGGEGPKRIKPPHPMLINQKNPVQNLGPFV